MEHVRWSTRPDLRAPIVLAAFEGWNDAGDAASTAARYLAERWDLRPVADIDPEEFFDFTTTRPEVVIGDGGERRIDWPSTEVMAGSIDGAGDVIVVVGHEPQLRWRTFTEALTSLAQDQGARLCVTLGALLAEVPHTRPTPVVGTSNEAGSIGGVDLHESTYEGPTGIVGVLHDAWRHAGLRTASLWATVPSYVPGAPSPKAALALIERVSAMVGIPVVTTDLEIAAASYERQVSELVEADEETSTYVTSLEERLDEEPEILPSAETIAEEVERFLRDQ